MVYIKTSAMGEGIFIIVRMFIICDGYYKNKIKMDMDEYNSDSLRWYLISFDAVFVSSVIVERSRCASEKKCSDTFLCAVIKGVHAMNTTE